MRSEISRRNRNTVPGRRVSRVPGMDVTRPTDAAPHCDLDVDGHGSHVTANVVAFCMERATHLLDLPSHTSCVHQPLNGSVFAPLKHTLVTETNAVVRPDAGRTPRVERSEMYFCAKE